MRALFFIVIFAVLLAGAFYLFSGSAGETLNIENPFSAREYTILFVGDIMLDRGVDYANQTQGTGAPTYPFEKIASTLREADVTIGNLEGPISDKGVNVGSEYSFRMDPKYIEGLKAAGFDVLSLANNHMFDYTAAALVGTVDRLHAAGIGTAGAGHDYTEANAPHIEELPDGTKIAFLSYTNLMPEGFSATIERPGISNPDTDDIKSEITNLKTSVDLVVLIWHWGVEYEPTSHPREQAIAYELIDAGADLIVGHHPHVPQEIEQYKGTYIAYSLGNFIFDQFFSEETMKGLMLEIKVKDKQIISAEPIPIQLTPTYQPYVAQ